MLYTINDLHLDFHTKFEKTEKFAEGLLPSDTAGGTLLIPGDIGHSNKQNARFLAFMKEYFDDVILVFGNHCYYNTKHGKTSSSMYRIEQARELYAEAGAILLEGTTHTAKDGVIIGGGTGWCDLTYGKRLGWTPDMTYNMYYKEFSDSRFIDCIKPDYFSYLEWAKARYDELEGILHADIIISHYPFDDGAISDTFKNDTFTSFFHFDGHEFYEALEGKIWCAGHTHDSYDYLAHECRFINNALGYPGEKAKTTIQLIN